MKRIIILAAVLVLAFAGVIGFLAVQTRHEDPQYLLSQLRKGGDDREDILMRFKLARGDLVGPMIEAFNDTEAPPEFRALLLDLLFVRHSQLPDERIEPVLRKAMTDRDEQVRRQAIEGMATYGSPEQQASLIDVIGDGDPDVREQIYLIFGASARPASSGLYEHLDEAQRDALAKQAAELAKKETDPQLAYRAWSVVGRRIECLIDEADQAIASGDMSLAREKYDRALEFDPTNHQARIRRIRFHRHLAETDKMVEAADQYGALLRIPKLDAAPVIDGDPTDAAWAKGLTSKHRFFRNTSRWTAHEAEGHTKAILGHYEGKLYIAIIGYEEHLDELVTTHRGRDNEIWRDDCVEIFFDPANEERQLFQFIVNSKGELQDTTGIYAGGYLRSDNSPNYDCEVGAAVFDQRGYAMFNSDADADAFEKTVKANPDWKVTLGRREKTDDGVKVVYWSAVKEGRNAAADAVKANGGVRTLPYWGFEFALDPSELNGASIHDQSVWGINVLRTRIGPGAEQTAWWPTYTGSWRPELFPIAVFEDAPPKPEGADKPAEGLKDRALRLLNIR